MSGPVFSADFRRDLDLLFAWRRDVRHFQPAPLPVGAMEELLELACHGPSVGNAQPWRFVRVQSSERRETLARAADACKQAAGQAYAAERGAIYAGLKPHGLREAPEIVAVFCDETAETGHGLGRATMPETLCWSVIAAIQTLWLAARARGIGLGWVSLIEPAAVNTMLSVPPDWRFVALLCLGYPETESLTPELVRHGWQAPLPPSRTRFVR
ncbi:5,6-dimethylbenzimidazole synthase [Novosphingobium sp.]|uniref:5,6-dimethylbenzimidazole synthase n=1 Tax=Novosphingobium sp. TaxID=1874826 RepID=UPI003BAC4CF1